MSAQLPNSEADVETQTQNEVTAAAPQAPKPSQPTARASRRDRKSASAFRTISEVAKTLDVQQHVLRFWETKFSQVRPLKRGGGRRYYRPEDVALLQSIHHLLYTEGYTIKGVQKLLREKGKNSVVQNNAPAAQPAAAAAPAPAKPQVHTGQIVASKMAPTGLDARGKSTLQDVLSELKELKTHLFSSE